MSPLGKEQKVTVWPRSKGALCPVACPLAHGKVPPVSGSTAPFAKSAQDGAPALGLM